jgi:putative ABC transport system permease protein
VSVLDRKLVRELAASKGMILASMSVIAVGVMCFIYMRSAYRNLSLEQNRYYIQTRLADFWIDLKKVPVAELDVLENLPGISEFRPRIQFFVTVDLPRVQSPLNGLVLSLPDRREPIINDIVLKRGSYFTDSRRNEVIVNDAFARKHGLYPGQVFHLILNNQRQELFIVGTAMSSEFVYLVGPGTITPDPEHFGVFYLKRTFAEEVFDFDGAANQVVGLLAPSIRDQPDDVLRQAESRLEPYGVFMVTPRRNQASNRFLSDEIRGLGVFATIMPLIFLAVAALVLNILMSRLVEQQQSVIGTLKGLGYTDGQLFWHFVKFAGIVGLSGGILGCIAGWGMSEFITSIYRRFFEFPRLVNLIDPFVYAGGLTISLGCALVGSLHGARQALRLQPAAAMRVKPPARGGHVWLERFGRLWRRLSSAWRMALRNVLRNRLRTGVGMFAAAMGAALLSCGFMLHLGTRYLVDFQFTLVQRSDIDLTFKDERGWDALQEVSRLPGVDSVEPVLDVACEFVNGPHRRKGAITGLVRGARLTMPRDKAANPIRIPSTGVAMTRKMAELLRVSPGDYVTAIPVKGLRQPLRIPVMEISDSYLGLGVYTEIDYLSHLIGEETAITGAQMKVDPRPEVRSALYKELKQLAALQGVTARADTLKNIIETIINTQQIFITLIVLFAGVIFFSSMLNASLIGLVERRREVATLRVLGYGEWQIGWLFLRESAVVNFLGTLLGLPLGYALVQVLANTYNTDLFRFPVQAPPSVYALTLLMACIFGLVAQLVVQRAINTLDWLDALKVKE